MAQIFELGMLGGSGKEGHLYNPDRMSIAGLKTRGGGGRGGEGYDAGGCGVVAQKGGGKKSQEKGNTARPQSDILLRYDGWLFWPAKETNFILDRDVFRVRLNFNVPEARDDRQR